MRWPAFVSSAHIDFVEATLVILEAPAGLGRNLSAETLRRLGAV